MKTSRLIAISGGIGSGKSIVCQILRHLGYPVYDCDSHARDIMDSDSEIKRFIRDEITPSGINPDGSINRRNLGIVVFGNAEKLELLNSAVHGAVKRHLAEWVECQDCDTVFVETAILYQSGLDRMVDSVWEVTAPVGIRVKRVMNRNGISENEVMARIHTQDSFVPEMVHESVHRIVNDGICPVLPRVEELLDRGADLE